MAIAKRKNITKKIQLEVSEQLHIAMLSSMFSIPSWKPDDIAFQGGTSIHLIWQSPRYSEDLDFVLRRDFAPELLGKTLQRAAKETEQQLTKNYPGCSVELIDKRKDEKQLKLFDLKWEDPNYFEKVTVKIEFWAIDQNLIVDYSRDLKPIALPFQNIKSAMSTVIPCAQTKSLQGDKVVALGARRPIKWRDMFDLYWITQQYGDIATNDLVELAKKSLSMYEADCDKLIQGLEEFVAMADEAIVEQSRKQLSAWLPENVFNALDFAAMVEKTKSKLSDVVHALKWTSKP